MDVDEKEFDNRLCDQVDQLLLNTSETNRNKHQKFGNDKTNNDQPKKKVAEGQIWNEKGQESSTRKNKDVDFKTEQKKKKKGRKNPKNEEVDIFKLRSRTETPSPSKEMNICYAASQQISDIEKQAQLWKQNKHEISPAHRHAHSIENIRILGNEFDGVKKSYKEAPIPLLARINARNISPTKLLQKHL